MAEFRLRFSSPGEGLTMSNATSGQPSSVDVVEQRRLNAPARRETPWKEWGPYLILPTLWFRNTWSWGKGEANPFQRESGGTIHPAMPSNVSLLGRPVAIVSQAGGAAVRQGLRDDNGRADRPRPVDTVSTGPGPYSTTPPRWDARATG